MDIKFRERLAVSAPLEAVTAFSIVCVMILFLFASGSQLLSQYQESEPDAYATAVEVAESLIRDPGMTEDGSPFWEDNPEKVEVVGLALPSTIEGYFIYNSSTGGGLFFLTETNLGSLSGTEDTCFLAGTPVLLANGSYKNIEDIKVGEKVRCYDIKNQSMAVGTVTKVFHHPRASMYVILNGCIKVTPNHAFLTVEGWKEVKDLKVGDKLVGGGIIFSIEPVYKAVPTYNLEVEPYHNYIVRSVVVHNPAVPPPPEWKFLPPPHEFSGSLIGGKLRANYNPSWLPDNDYTTTGFDVEVVNQSGDTYICYIKKKLEDDNPYPVLDWRKIEALVNSVSYDKFKESLGLDWRYDVSLRIILSNGTVIKYPNKDFDESRVSAEFSRNVVVFTPSNFSSSGVLEAIPIGEIPSSLTGSYQLATMDVIIYR